MTTKGYLHGGLGRFLFRLRAAGKNLEGVVTPLR